MLICIIVEIYILVCALSHYISLSCSVPCDCSVQALHDHIVAPRSSTALHMLSTLCICQHAASFGSDEGCCSTDTVVTPASHPRCFMLFTCCAYSCWLLLCMDCTLHGICITQLRRSYTLCATVCNMSAIQMTRLDNVICPG